MILKNKKYLVALAAFVLISMVGFVSCDDPYENGVDYSKLEAGELKLREAYYEAIKDTMLVQAIDTIDKRDSEGWIAFVMEKGSDDPVQVGKSVSFRYTYYHILEDDDAKPVAVPQYTNYGSDELAEFTVGGLTGSEAEIIPGVDRVVRYMNLYDKAYVILPHRLAFNDYFAVVAEIEVVAMQLD